MISVFFLSRRPNLLTSFMNPHSEATKNLEVVVYAIAEEPLSIVTNGRNLHPNLVLRAGADPLAIERDLTPSTHFTANLLLREQLLSYASERNRSHSYSLDFHEDLSNPRVTTHQLEFSTTVLSTIAVYKYFGDEPFMDYIRLKSADMSSKRHLIATEVLSQAESCSTDHADRNRPGGKLSNSIVSTLVNPEVMIPAMLTSGIAIFLNGNKSAKKGELNKTEELVAGGDTRSLSMKGNKKNSLLDMIINRKS